MFDPRSSSESGEESVAASVELCARTRYFNMLPSRLDGFGSVNFLSFFFFFRVGGHVLTRGSDQINAYLNQSPTMRFYDKAFQ